MRRCWLLLSRKQESVKLPRSDPEGPGPGGHEIVFRRGAEVHAVGDDSHAERASVSALLITGQAVRKDHE